MMRPGCRDAGRPAHRRSVGSGPFHFLKDQWRRQRDGAGAQSAYVPRKEAPDFLAA